MKRPHHTSRKRGGDSLAAHPVFAPLLGLWGAALVGLSIMVLPAQLIAGASAGTGLSLLGDAAQAVLAGVAALVVGGTMFLFASQLTRRALQRADVPSIASIATRRVRTINPSMDLGSLRLDDPVETEPFADLRTTDAPISTSEQEPDVAETMPPPRALDLAEFAQLPGRNAVWVEEPTPAVEPASVASEPTPEPAATQPIPLAAVAPVAQPDRKPALPLEHPSEAALARLRAAPPEQLSLAEMVERFAGALHEHRETAPGRSMTPQDIAAREAALAEALRALAALGGIDRPAATSEPLADALTRLHGVRGAA